MRIPTLHRNPRGFTIVELMVATAIALIGMLVIFQVYAVSEGYRRTTTGGGDAQQNGAVALYTLTRELRMAGYGFNSSAALGCNVLSYDVNQGVIAPYALAPVRITQGPANGSDTVEVSYGSQDLMAAPVSVASNQVNSTDPYVLKNRYGFNLGDTFLVVEPLKSCTLAQVTSLPAAPLSNNIVHDATDAAYYYNQPGGSGVLYTFNGQVFNLGPAPARNIYSIDPVKMILTLQAILSGSAQAQNVADGIVQLKAQYGKDNGVNNGTVVLPTYAANDGVVDSFDNVAPVTAADWAQVLAVRVGIVARSAQPEKPKVQGGPCDATTVAPNWEGGNFDLSANPTWQCYRYKVFQTTVPIRNMIWTQG